MFVILSKNIILRPRAWGGCARGLIIVLFFLASLEQAGAQSFVATIYSDGLSCPAECDAHVVFSVTHNGSSHAFAPGSSRAKPKACAVGQECNICFDGTDSSCLTVVYRGGGPAPGRFDFTPAFFEKYCPKKDIPTQIRNLCSAFQARYDRLVNGKIYCVSKPSDVSCVGLIGAAEERKAIDQKAYLTCVKMGEAAFNRTQPRSGQRSNACTYEKYGTGGPNGKGQTWRRLLPAACPAGSYVGRDGLDCCDKNHMSLGGLGGECTPYLATR